MTGGGVTAGIDFGLALLAEWRETRPPRRSSSISNTRRRRRSSRRSGNGAACGGRGGQEAMAPILAERAKLVAEAAKRLGLGG